MIYEEKTMPDTPSLRPALLAQNPHPVRDGLCRYGIHVRTLLLQEGGDLLPVTEPPLIIDLRGQTLQDVAQLLLAVQRRQQGTHLVPHLLVNPHIAGILRLIVGVPTVRAVVLDGDDLATLAMWLRAPLALVPGQLWVNVAQPAPQPALTALVAALDGAESIAMAAQRCAMSEGTAYRLLRTLDRGKKRRSVEEWAGVVEQAVNNNRKPNTYDM